jgi:hypothetical protein
MSSDPNTATTEQEQSRNRTGAGAARAGEDECDRANRTHTRVSKLPWDVTGLLGRVGKTAMSARASLVSPPRWSHCTYLVTSYTTGYGTWYSSHPVPSSGDGGHCTLDSLLRNKIMHPLLILKSSKTTRVVFLLRHEQGHIGLKHNRSLTSYLRFRSTARWSPNVNKWSILFQFCY